jgi:hypothetical protein
VTQLKAQNTKDIYSFFSGTDAINYIKAWTQLGMTAAGYKMNGAGFLTEQDVLKEVKEQANGATTSLFWAVTLDNAENKGLRRPLSEGVQLASLTSSRSRRGTACRLSTSRFRP